MVNGSMRNSPRKLPCCGVTSHASEMEAESGLSILKLCGMWKVNNKLGARSMCFDEG